MVFSLVNVTLTKLNTWQTHQDGSYPVRNLVFSLVSVTLTKLNTWQTLQDEGYPVRIIVRKTERGLSSAVLRGMREGV